MTLYLLLHELFTYSLLLSTFVSTDLDIFRFWLYDNGVTLKDEEATVLKVFEQAAQRHDCKVFLIDNLMTVDYGRLPEKDYYLQQGNFINQLAVFASLYNVHVHLVAHPRKTQSGQKGIQDSDEVGGSGSVTNRASNVITVSRAQPGSGIDVTLDILKNRWEGKKGAIGLCYEPRSRRIYSPTEGCKKQYGWEHYGCTEIEQTTTFEEL